jgi:acyl-CoA hydrolase
VPVVIAVTVAYAMDGTPASQEPLESPLPDKPVSASLMTLSQVIFPKDTNELGLATAGVILKNVDIAASLTAARHCGRNIVTASLDRMDFIYPARLWEVVSTHCRMTATWKTSMEVQVQVNAENVFTGECRRVALGYLVFVAVDHESHKTCPVPPLTLESPEEKRLGAKAEIRRQERLAERRQTGEKARVLIDDSDFPEQVARTMTTDDANINHNVFGGIILELVHQAGEKAAIRQVNGPMIAVRQDRMNFEQPAYIGEEVRARALVTRVWRTSLEVQVEVTARDYKTGEERLVANSYLVFVGQNPDGTPKPVLPYEPRTEKQRVYWLEAEVRRQVRLRERHAHLNTP